MGPCLPRRPPQTGRCAQPPFVGTIGPHLGGPDRRGRQSGPTRRYRPCLLVSTRSASPSRGGWCSSTPRWLRCARTSSGPAGAVLGTRVDLEWSEQPAEPGSRRAELSWTGPVGTGAALASALSRLTRIRFEVTEEPTPGSDGQRYCFTPTLGAFSAVVGVHGDILVPEDRLRHAVATEALGGEPLAQGTRVAAGRARGTRNSTCSGTPARTLPCGGSTRWCSHRPGVSR